MEFFKKVKLLNVSSVIIAILIILIFTESIQSLFNEPSDIWDHIRDNLLMTYVKNTVFILLGTIVCSVIIGVTSAYLTSMYEFRLSKFFTWALMLPLSIPPYIGCYIYYEMLSYTGIIQSIARDIFGYTGNGQVFSISNIYGAIFIFTITLYPYIFMMTKAFFMKSSSSYIENARILGMKNKKILSKVMMPLATIPIIASTTLVGLEVLSDYGVVSYLGVETLSTAIFKSWTSFMSLDSAIRIASILLVVVVAFMMFEIPFLRRKKFSPTTSKQRPIKKVKLKGINGIFATSFCLLVFLVSFFVPIMQLIYWAIKSLDNIVYDGYMMMIFNTLWLAGLCTIIIMVISSIVATNKRNEGSTISKICGKITMVGYSVPGAVLAMIVILYFKKLDTVFGLGLSVTIFMLIFAYILKFLGIGYENINAGYEKVGKKFYDASKTLGRNNISTFWFVDIPTIKYSLISTFCLVFLDIIKELPLVLNLRTFNFYTLSTKVFNYANDEMIPESSIPSLTIILISIVFLYVVNRISKRSE